MSMKPTTWTLRVLPIVIGLWCGRATAEEPRETALRIAVYVDGPGAEALRAKILTLVPLGVDVADETTLPKAFGAARGRRRGALGEVAVATKRRNELLESIHRAAETSGIHAVVVGRLETTKSGERQLRLVGIDANSSEPTLDRKVALSPETATEILRGAFGTWLDDVGVRNGFAEQLTLTGPPSASTAAPVGGSRDVVDAPAAIPDSRAEVSLELFELGAGIEVWSRSFEYSDPLPAAAGRQRSHDVPAALAVIASGALYPFATSPIAVVRDIGVTGELARDLGIDSEPASTDGRLEKETVASSYTRARVGLRGRIRTGGARAPVIGVKAGYGWVSFAFDSPTPRYDGALPSVSYSMLTAGADARVPIGRFAAIASAEYLAPLAGGGVAGRFRGTSMGGVDLRAGLSAPVARSIEARLVGGYTRYFYSFAPAIGDAYVAGGALDQYLSVSIGAAYVF